MAHHLFKRMLSAVLVFLLGLALNAFAAEGYIDLLSKSEQGNYTKHGWNHYGPGYFTLDESTGVLSSHGGMGVFWYSVRKFRDFELELDFMCDKASTNSGVFLRMPHVPTSNDYIYECFEIQIYDDTSTTTEKVFHDPKARTEFQLKHTTGAIYDANPPTKFASYGPGKWNHYKLTCKGLRYIVELNGQVVNDWMAQPMGKVATHWPEGYIGLQNHDDTSSVHFRNIRIKDLSASISDSVKYPQ